MTSSFSLLVVALVVFFFVVALVAAVVVVAAVFSVFREYCAVPVTGFVVETVTSLCEDTVVSEAELESVKAQEESSRERIIAQQSKALLTAAECF